MARINLFLGENVEESSSKNNPIGKRYTVPLVSDYCLKEENLYFSDLKEKLLRDSVLKSTKVSSFSDELLLTDDSGSVSEEWVVSKLSKLPSSALSSISSVLTQYRKQVSLDFETVINTFGWLDLKVVGGRRR